MHLRKCLGIIGGMGPAATSLFFQKLIEYSGAERDQEHIEIFLHNNVNIPDRTRALVEEDQNPLDELARSVRLLEQCGVDFIAVPCMTAHYFLPELANKTSIPILDAIKETIRIVKSTVSQKGRVGILATTGTITTGLFQREMEKYGLQPLIPSTDLQQLMVMESIYGESGIKAGNVGEGPKNKLKHVCENLTEMGAEAIILGCTEIPLVIGGNEASVPVIDPLEALAKLAARIYYDSLQDITQFVVGGTSSAKGSSDERS